MSSSINASFRSVGNKCWDSYVERKLYHMAIAPCSSRRVLQILLQTCS